MARRTSAPRTSARPRRSADAPPTPASAYRLDRLRVRHVRLLDLIASGGSLGNAARALKVSQPAATLLLRELEEVVGAALVARSARGCRLTAAGQRALDRLRVALASVDRAIEAARSAGDVPLLRLGCVQLAGVAHLPEALARLERRGTFGRIHVEEGRASDLLARLGAGELDCVVGWVDESTTHALPVETLSIHPLAYGRMQVVAAPRHPLAARRQVSVAELVDARWIVARRGSRTHDAFVRLFLDRGLPAPVAAVECSALHTALHLVARTRLLAMAPDVVVAGYARQGLLVPLAGPELQRDASPVCVITRRDSEALPVVRDLVDALLAAGGRRAPAPVRRARTPPA